MLHRLPDSPDRERERSVRSRNPAGWLSLLAVLVFVIIWWLFSGNGPQGPDGNDPRFLPPDVDASGAPGDSGDGGPVPIAVAEGVRILSFEQTEQGLELRARVMAGDCAVLETPTVLETDVAVTVTLTHATEDCRPLPRAREILTGVRLDAPLGDRAVLDGALEQRVRVEPAT